MATPHIGAEKGAFAKTVLMPGDPLRAKYIAEHYLQDYEEVTHVRGILGYTGQYQGHRVSVMASGMGVPSIGIYSYELYHFFDVDNIIRIGTAGGVSEKLKLRDVVIAMSAATNSGFASQYRLPGIPAPTASYTLLKNACDAAEELHKTVHVGQVFTTDMFYDDAESLAQWRKIGILATEMECAGLYLNAARLGKNALTICTVSDCPLTGESCSAEERETSFCDMMEIGLLCAVKSDTEE